MPTARRPGVWAVSLLLIWSAAAARADVVFNSLPANDSSGWTATGSDSGAGADYDIAQPFTVTADRRFADVQLPLFSARRAAVANVWLMADGGSGPGALIEQIRITDIATSGWPVKTVESALHPLLSAGQTYWIAISTDRGSDVAWGEVASGVKGHWYRMNQGPWQFDPGNNASAFRVDGIPVPEPSCIAAVALLAVALRRPRRA